MERETRVRSGMAAVHRTARRPHQSMGCRMAITGQDKRELDQFYSDHSEKYGGCKEDYFALLHLMKKFKCSVEEAARHVAFGGNDYGIDAYYIDKEARNLYLFQFKWSENHNLFKDSLDRLAKDGMERIFGKVSPDPAKNALLSQLGADLYENQSIIQRVLVQFVFKGDMDAAENSEGLLHRRENVENKQYLVHQYFSNTQVGLTVQFVTDRPTPPKKPPVDVHPVHFMDHVSMSTPDGKTMHVGFVCLMDLFRIYKALGQTFLNRNIRAGLSPDNAPNRKIREALADIVLKGQSAPELFTFNHNGVTLATEQIDFPIEAGPATVRVPRLLNGAQTLTSVVKFLEDNDGHPALNDNNAVLESIKVLAKVIVDDPFSDFVTNVTVCNNRQNPVEPWNLRANDRIQCDLQDKFKEELSIFYSRQERAFENLSGDDAENYKDQPIRIKPLAQTFLAVQGEITKMSKLPDVFENQKTYEDTFRQSHLKCDSRKIVLAYKVHLVIRSPMDRLYERAAEKYLNAIGRAKNLVWALLIQGLLNDEKLGNLLEWYGSDLNKQAQFREYLKDVASSRLLPILRELFNDKSYAAKLKAEKYDFLRTKETFNRCMEIAYGKYGWTKKWL